MTSIVEAGRASAPVSWLRALLLLSILLLLAILTAPPWGGLWLAVPLGVAVSLLAAWRFGARGFAIPVALAPIAVWLDGPTSAWAWWPVAAALSGAWMGMREEGGGPTAGERAFMLLPLLLLAGALPWAPGYAGLVEQVRAQGAEFSALMLDASRRAGYTPERLSELELAIENLRVVARHALPHLLPTALFLWMAVLVTAGRALAGRIATLLKWPPLSEPRLKTLRLPDGALWIFIVSLAALVAQLSAWSPTAWTLLLNTGFGFCVQGIAVVESLLLARGVPSTIIILTLLFVFIVTGPFFMATVAAVGLSDVWLDFRRLESGPDGTIPE